MVRLSSEMQRSINIYNSTSCIIAQNVESSLSLPCVTGFVRLGKNTVLDLKPGFHLIAAITEKKKTS